MTREIIVSVIVSNVIVMNFESNVSNGFSIEIIAEFIALSKGH